MRKKNDENMSIISLLVSIKIKERKTEEREREKEKILIISGFYICRHCRLFFFIFIC